MDRAVLANAVAITFVVIAAPMGGRYCWKTFTHRATPRLATWLIFLVASTLSLASYLAHAHANVRASFAANIGNRMDAVELLAIVAAILFSSRHEPERRHLKRFDWYCLASAFLIVMLWAATGSNVMANLLLQMLMCVGYGPTLWHLLKEKRNTEPLDIWCANLFLALLALAPPLLSRPCDWLAVIYAGRATLCVVVLLAVMVYFHRQKVVSTQPR